jgi:PKD repeat protein
MKKVILFITFSLAGYFVKAQVAAPCIEASSRTTLDINNVRAMIQNGGDMWWNFRVAQYEIPKGSGIHSMFAGAVWIGGVDANNQLKVSAQMFRQGNDFWPGPLKTGSAETNINVCSKFDRLFKLNYYEVEEFKIRYNDPNYTIPEAVLNWPAHGNIAEGYAEFLAPFVDVNGDNKYNPKDGDYPAFDYDKNLSCENKLYGHQNIWWVFNDKGNIQTQTGGNSIGIEIQAQAFAFNTNDAINDATFYHYKIINRSSSTLFNTWFGLWADPDLGRYDDDFIGCDVQRGMGYCYNGREIDGSGGPGEYGAHPPAIGIDFLKGPLMDNDGMDNAFGIGAGQSINGYGFGDGIPDNERWGMNRFINIRGPGIGWFDVFPASDNDHYNYLRGIWRDGNKMRYFGMGHPSNGGTGVECNYMFPGNSDPLGFGTGGVPQPEWSEITEGNQPYDRRFLMSSGPFTLEPGAVNSVSIGTMWARDMNGNHLDAIPKLQAADDLAQQLADACFNLQACIPPFADFHSEADNLKYNFAYYGDASSTVWRVNNVIVSNSKYFHHTFPRTGNYNVCLTVTNNCGTKNICKNIRAELPGPGVSLIRIEGQGGGGNVLDFRTSTINEILAKGKSNHPLYRHGQGPVSIEVLDPDQPFHGNYTLFFTGVDETARWKLFRAESNDTITSSYFIKDGGVDTISKWKLRVVMKPISFPGKEPENGNGFLEATKSFEDPTKPWLSGIPDIDGHPYQDWIRSGRLRSFTDFTHNDFI